jgi:hypothetical protein
VPNLYSPHSYLGLTALLLGLAQVSGGPHWWPQGNTLACHAIQPAWILPLQASVACPCTSEQSVVALLPLCLTQWVAPVPSYCAMPLLSFEQAV